MKIRVVIISVTTFLFFIFWTTKPNLHSSDHLMSSASTRLLHLQELEKRYGSHPVLSIPEWSISEGIYWIHGENGAGKTTLFRILAGQLPYSGKIVLDDRYDQK